MHMFTVMTCAVRIDDVSALYSVPGSSHDLRSSVLPLRGPHIAMCVTIREDLLIACAGL